MDTVIAAATPNLILILVAVIGLLGAFGSPLLVIRANERARVRREAAEKEERETERKEQKKERDTERLAEFDRQAAAAEQVRIAAATLAVATEAAAAEARTAAATLATATEAAASEARTAAERLETTNAAVAAEALRQQEAVASAAETARKALAAADARREIEAKDTTSQLDSIKELAVKTHELTNSQYTAMMEETLDANEGRLVTLLEIKAMQEHGGGSVTDRTLATIEATEKKIDVLKHTLEERAKRTASGDEQTQR